jgi:hypothetical protein
MRVCILLYSKKNFKKTFTKEFFISFLLLYNNTIHILYLRLRVHLQKKIEDLVWFLPALFSVNKNIKVIRKSATFLVKLDLKPHQTFVILLFHFPC